MFKQRSRQRNFFATLAGSMIKAADQFRRIVGYCGKQLKATRPMWIGYLLLIIAISLKSPIVVATLIIGSLIAISNQKITQQSQLSPSKRILIQMLIALITVSLIWVGQQQPAAAQFFKRAEDFFQNTLTQGTSNTSNTQLAVGLVFNVLRALYLLYIAVALIGVVNAVRKDEDWQNIARTPLLVVVAVTIADVLTGFVIGSGR
jgi:uncharacterized membrane protein required for colicin V production